MGLVGIAYQTDPAQCIDDLRVELREVGFERRVAVERQVEADI